VHKLLFIGSLLVLSAVLGATVFREPVAWAAQAVDAHITNLDANGNIRVHEQGTANVAVQGTPSVTVSGTAKVQPVETPFQQVVQGGGGDFGGCDAITPPTDTKLRIQSFTAEVSVSPEGSPKPDIFLVADAFANHPDGSGEGLTIRGPALDLTPLGSGWVGTMSLDLYTGAANDPHDFVVHQIRVCISRGVFRGLVGGTLIPSS
jgi:hypothetical protein